MFRIHGVEMGGQAHIDNEIPSFFHQAKDVNFYISE